MKRIFLILLLPLIFSSCQKQEPEKKSISFKLISQYETKIYDKIPDRLNNLNICAGFINGLILNPGEEFSFNGVVGERTLNKGYKNAVTYDENGEKKMDVGGGICQISSTLHMALKLAGFEITERHDHKKEVPYEALGNDAAVYYNTQDFKFINNKDKKIKLEIIINGTMSVISKIYLAEE